MTRADDLPPEELDRRREALERLRQRYDQIMADAKREFDQWLKDGQTVSVAGFVRRRKGAKGG
jgi:hypothetical protein